MMHWNNRNAQEKKKNPKMRTKLRMHHQDNEETRNLQISKTLERWRWTFLPLWKDKDKIVSLLEFCII